MLITQANGDAAAVALLESYGALSKPWAKKTSSTKRQLVYDPPAEADATRGTAESRFVKLVDLAATFLEIAGGDPHPHKLEGHSQLPLLHGTKTNSAETTWRNYTVSEIGYSGRAARQILDSPLAQCRGYMIRNERRKYALWARTF